MKRACQVMDLRSQAVPSFRRKVDLSLDDSRGPPSGEPGHTGSPNEGLEGGCLAHRPPAQFET